MTPQEIEALRSEALKDKVDALSDMVNILKAGRDALLQELHKANSIIIDLQRNPPKFTAEHLRDVQAEAGRAGYLQGLLSVLEEMEEYGAADVRNAEREADKYAAKVRQGGAE